nr:hypothetical protein [Spirosoma rhododendri]
MNSRLAHQQGHPVSRCFYTLFPQFVGNAWTTVTALTLSTYLADVSQ